MSKKITINMASSKAKLSESKNKDMVLEFLKNARTLKRQIQFIREINFEEKEAQMIKDVLEAIKEEITLMKV